MEQEFRTTFIPKKPMVTAPASSTRNIKKPVGIFFSISVLIFVATLVSAGGVYLYKTYLTKELNNLTFELEAIEKKIDGNFIKEVTVIDKRLKNSETILNQHTVIAPLFMALGESTLPTVRYTKLDVSFDDTKNLVAKLSGESDGYRSIALQSQALAEKTSLKNIIFSNFIVTPKGRVSFDVSFTLPITDLSFEKFINANPVQTSEIPVESITTDQTVRTLGDSNNQMVSDNSLPQDTDTGGIDGIIN